MSASPVLASPVRIPPCLADTPLFWLALGGLGIWLGFPNDVCSVPPLVLLWPVSLVVLGMRAPGLVVALRRGWLTSWLGCAAALYWLALPVHEVGGLPLALAIPCALCIAACLASAGGLFSACAFWLRGWSGLLLPLILALVWYLLEWLYAVLVGFPWLPLAGGLIVWPVMAQAADVLGAFGLGAVWLLAALLCLAALPPARTGLAAGHAARRRNAQGFWPGAAVSGLCLALCLTGYGLWRLAENPLQVEPRGPDSMGVLFVEGNVDQNQKWLPSFQRQTVELYASLTAEGLAASQQVLQPGPALIIWPETAMPFFYEANPILAGLVAQTPRHAALPLLFGAPGMEKRPDQSEAAIFNRAFLLGADGQRMAHYDKEHLVPFGEYLPAWLDWKFLEALLQGVGVYEEGVATAPLRHGNLALGLLICYEAIFPWLAQERVAEGANILVDISNDGWFGHSPAARQHLYLTALRALEQGRWILRGTNTGISAVVDARGRLTVSGTQFRTGSLAARAVLREDRSLYHVLAPWLPALAVLLCLGLLAWGRPRRTARHIGP